MSSASFPDLRAELAAVLAFEPAGAASGNLTTGLGSLDGVAIEVAFIDNRVASGSIGAHEAPGLGSVFRRAAATRTPVVLCLDSAGAKVSEGLPALGGFRALFRDGLAAVIAGAPIAAVLGRNCFGGGSMLAHLATHRLFSPATRLAMSGPAIMASAAGMNPLDETFRAMADAAISPAARARASAANTPWVEGTDLAAWLRKALAPVADPIETLSARHVALGARFAPSLGPVTFEAVRRRDLERIYAEGYEARESAGLIAGQAQRRGSPEAFVGLVGNAPLASERAWRFAEIVWDHAARRTPRLEVFLDCASHAARLEDERRVLTEYIVDMSAALAAAAQGGTRVGLTVLGKAGGGVYVALAAPAARVASVHGSDIQVLPASSVAAILGSSHAAATDFAHYRDAGVAEEEIKLGLVP